MIKDLKLGVWLDVGDVAKMATEDGIALDVEHAETIELKTASSALSEAAKQAESQTDA